MLLAHKCVITASKAHTNTNVHETARTLTPPYLTYVLTGSSSIGLWSIERRTARPARDSTHLWCVASHASTHSQPSTARLVRIHTRTHLVSPRLPTWILSGGASSPLALSSHTSNAVVPQCRASPPIVSAAAMNALARDASVARNATLPAVLALLVVTSAHDSLSVRATCRAHHCARDGGE
jgi:hypothetical protein